MYVIGERLNGMFKRVRIAIQEGDKKVIHEIAEAQLKAGAQALDLNVGPASDKPVDAMMWLVEATREATDAPLAIDSPRWDVQSTVVPKVPGHAIINSCKADPAELEKYVDLAVKNDASLIGLCIDESGVPADAEKRVELGATIAATAIGAGMAPNRLFIDPIILPVNVAPTAPGAVMSAMSQLKVLSDPPPHLVLGLSNVSQGCNERKLINRIYTVMAISAGMDSVILDPNDTDLMNAAITAELLQQRTIYCDSFLDAYRMSVKAVAP
jgi:5-methyltetrahydrofolate corrinoid/iron sulfur protein methyltransferase